MANTYRGSAVIVVEGVDYPAEADLSIHSDRNAIGVNTLRTWGGTLESDPSIDWFGPREAHHGVIRMPDGRQGRFLVTAGTLGSGRVEISGTGPAPFGDD
ncbi:DUF4873 domain-containing protein [Streptomyces sp. NBC_00140]|uniref:DUF4873 domain-containing protein n=1 Tax=Streptomyces sp. NBC_00140 TaxID=2975664 RepID=UPI0022537AF1|nr:DUF4873 domain-containing protein [Streptomyces sp. NBC_00140]MCX5335492.1 DUF4873 domain-containing protein [Streptomyces sp. NBC_00140]MCX5338328.1 DUF4873 domain-containing protein [Streptomyces sp. NBC_00140]